MNKIVFDISNLEDEKNILESVELACSLYESHKQGSQEHASNCLKKTRVELFLNTKKELSIAESPFLKLVSFVNFQFGGANCRDSRTLREILDSIKSQ